MTDNFTVKQFAALFPADDELPRMLRRKAVSRSGEYRQFVDILYDDIDVCLREFQKSPELRQKDSEDRLTEELNVQLRRLGYDATHDTSAGGHVDITVKLGTLSWIGEAKKDQKFIEGFRQLTTRYRPASGNPDHNAFGLILYLVKDGARVKDKLKAWRMKMQKEGLEQYKDWDCPRNSFAFYSAHIADWSGMPVFIRHMMVGMHHDPQDASARATKARAAAKAKPMRQ